MPRNLNLNKRNVSFIASALVGIILMIPAISPASILSNLAGFSPTDDHNHPTASKVDTFKTPASMAEMNMNQHYNLISQSIMDSFIQKAYATGTSRHFTLIASEGVTTLPTGDKVGVFSFNGSVPAPTLRVNQGDVVEVNVINPENNEDVHSIDFHGSQLSAVPNFAAVKQGESKTLTFVAVNPGVWAYHCEANNVFELWEHPLKGM